MSRWVAHLIKLAVGARTIADIAAWQASRREGRATTTTVPTRQFPKRAGEIVAGGSLYWVVVGLVAVRQEIADIRETRAEDGTRMTAIVVRRDLVPVQLRAQRPFQGWRYLERDAAPAALAAGNDADATALPAALVRELASLCLI